MFFEEQESTPATAALDDAIAASVSGGCKLGWEIFLQVEPEIQDVIRERNLPISDGVCDHQSRRQAYGVMAGRIMALNQAGRVSWDEAGWGWVIGQQVAEDVPAGQYVTIEPSGARRMDVLGYLRSAKGREMMRKVERIPLGERS
jgi:hypothetical protein